MHTSKVTGHTHSHAWLYNRVAYFSAAYSVCRSIPRTSDNVEIAQMEEASLRFRAVPCPTFLLDPCSNPSNSICTGEKDLLLAKAVEDDDRLVLPHSRRRGQRNGTACPERSVQKNTLPEERINGRSVLCAYTSSMYNSVSRLPAQNPFRRRATRQQRNIQSPSVHIEPMTAAPGSYKSGGQAMRP